MIERNRKNITTYELLYRGYIVKVIIDKKSWSYTIESALGQSIAGDNSLEYHDDHIVSYMTSKIIDDYIDGESKEENS